MIELKILLEMEPVPNTAEVVKMVRDLESLTSATGIHTEHSRPGLSPADGTQNHL